MVSSEEQLKRFLTRQRVLLNREQQAEIDRTSLLLSNCSPKLLEQKGLALGGLTVVNVSVGLGGKSMVELERTTAYHTSPLFPPHTFRTGDLARIEENVTTTAAKKPTKTKKATGNDDRETSNVEGVVYKVTDQRVIISVDASDAGTEALDLPERCRVVKLANSVTYDRMEKTLDTLERMVIPSREKGLTPELTQLFKVLVGLASMAGKLSIGEITFFNESLNPSQQAAVRFALEAPEIACIHGPPGTGKTHTLVEIIRQLALTTTANPTPKRILVCGASNLSVDNILERLLALPAHASEPAGKAEKLRMTRIGHPARVIANESVISSTLEMQAARSDQAELARDVKAELENALGILSGKGKGVKGKGPRGAERRQLWGEVKELRKEYRKREGGVVKAVLGDAQIVLATTHSAGGRQLFNHIFDVVIIDEATQALEMSCWIPILKSKKLILAGDPMQLPPTIISLNERTKQKKAKETKPAPSESKAAKKAPVLTAPSTKVLPDPATSTSVEDDLSGLSSSSEDEDEIVPAAGDVSEPTVPLSAKEGNARSSQKKKKKSANRELRPPRTLETTLFDRLERMYGPGIKRMLDVQYRMHKQIASFPSDTLYGGKLIADESVAAHLLTDLPNTSLDDAEEEAEVLGTPVVFFDTAGCEYFERLEGDADEGSHCNENEATVVKNWVERLVSGSVSPSQIAIITPYQAQVTLLTTLLRPMYGQDIEIGTVDGMQGREKEAVVISLVRSNDKREVGFLKEKRRLNVAMTRAKRHLCVVGDSSTVQHGSPYLKKWMEWLDKNADVKHAGLE